MNKVLSLHHSDLFIKENVGTKEQRKDLKKQILQEKKDDTTTISGGNIGCWRTLKTYQNIEWLTDTVKEIVEEANSKYVSDDIAFQKTFNEHSGIVWRYWTNVNEVGSKNILHTHSNDVWAGIYYVQAEGTGNINFYNSANILLQCNPKSPFTRRAVLSPKDGDLYLWPGWVPHDVETNNSDKQRINLAWGINFKQ